MIHHPNCNANYPEKIKDEPAQYIVREILDDGFYVDTCVDCGATETDLPSEDDPYWDDVRDAIQS